MPIYRNDQFLVQVAVAGIGLDSQPWDGFSGGDTSGAAVNANPGGQGGVAMGGLQSRGPITLERIWSDVLINAWGLLDQASNRAAVSVKVTTRDANGNPTGRTATYTGILNTVTKPPFDGGGGSEARMTMTVDANFAIAYS